MTPVKIQALEYGIPVYQPVKVKTPEFVEVLKKEAPDAIVVIAFGQILSKEILDLPKYGCVNIHASLLPNTVVQHLSSGLLLTAKRDRCYYHDDGCWPGYR